ncbi:MAG: hypothetical protein KC441_12230 [Anaerolineales bacterium]|nr:hypothetical protein [Anaerolineales bacterium]MCA9943400.1 hypothetical protein [Anaerolineales bacterium]
MSQKQLFAAEVNQIQKTLFAADLQRQVVGGSRMLDLFTEQGAAKATTDYAATDIIVKAGGTFRIEFENADEAVAFGRQLADTYQLLLNGVMTVAPPEPFDDEKPKCKLDDERCRLDDDGKCYRCAEKELGRKLNRLKEGGRLPLSLPHSPTIALCESSGAGLAFDHVQPDPNEPAQYMSKPAHLMKEVGHREKPGSPRRQDDENKYLEAVRGEITNSTYRSLGWADKPEDMAYWDRSRSNVAYMVADGNNMGIFFSRCTAPEQRKQLSKLLEDAIAKAIAAPVATLIDRLWDSSRAGKRPLEIPMLPLIRAGDDIFVLLPAPYALDYARHFCQEFETLINNHEVIKEMRQDETERVTMSAAIVYCKQSYPYHLVHEYGEELLAQAKRVTKRVGRLKTGQQWLSSVSFGMIIGSESTNRPSYAGSYYPTLTTYWVGEPTVPAAKASAVELAVLFSQRLELRKVPAKRRAEVRNLFDDPPEETAQLDRWNGRLQKLFRRMQATNPDTLKRTQKALTDLGDAAAITKTNPACWRFHADESKHFHGLPDLFAIWPYAQTFAEALDLYDEEEHA